MRKTSIVTISEEGRDFGKVFLLTEMPAAKAEKWAIRAVLAAAKSGLDMPEGIEQAGMAGIAVLCLQALPHLNFYDAEPLLDEMFECVQCIPDAKIPNVVRPLIDDDIEEIKTRLRLRSEVLQLHVGFSIPGETSKSTLATPAPASKNIRTSRVRSGR